MVPFAKEKKMNEKTRVSIQSVRRAMRQEAYDRSEVPINTDVVIARVIERIERQELDNIIPFPPTPG